MTCLCSAASGRSPRRTSASRYSWLGARAIFSVARIDCFLSLRPQDIVDVDKDWVRVVPTRLKGEARREEHVLTFFTVWCH